MTKEDLIKAIKYMEQLPPSKWDAPLIIRFKEKVLRPWLKGLEEGEDLYKVAEKMDWTK